MTCRTLCAHSWLVRSFVHACQYEWVRRPEACYKHCFLAVLEAYLMPFHHCILASLYNRHHKITVVGKRRCKRPQTVCIASHSPYADPAMSLHVVRMVCLSRMFWPKEIWGLYGEALADFKEPSNASQAVQCLNHMVTDALRSDMRTWLDESPTCITPVLCNVQVSSNSVTGGIWHLSCKTPCCLLEAIMHDNM